MSSSDRRWDSSQPQLKDYWQVLGFNPAIVDDSNPLVEQQQQQTGQNATFKQHVPLLTHPVDKPLAAMHKLLQDVLVAKARPRHTREAYRRGLSQLAPSGLLTANKCSYDKRDPAGQQAACDLITEALKAVNRTGHVPHCSFDPSLPLSYLTTSGRYAIAAYVDQKSSQGLPGLIVQLLWVSSFSIPNWLLHWC
jgi:hypothetical protein